jgi:hypothetical protein
MQLSRAANDQRNRSRCSRFRRRCERFDGHAQASAMDDHEEPFAQAE